MVLRPAAGGFELFMGRRNSKNRFLPDRYVFPGGRLETGDSSAEALERLYGLPDAATPLFRDTPKVGAWQQVNPLSRAEEIGLWVAALRELFEEAGVLLAVDELTCSPRDIHNEPATRQRFAGYRQAMAKNELDFIAMLQQEKLKLDLSRLIYFSHWITPLTEKYRFDTRFFLTHAPANQIAEIDNQEMFDGIWIRPQEALAQSKAGQMSIIYPTLMHLEWLSRYGSIEEACEAGQKKRVVAAMPDQLSDDEINPIFLLPAEIRDSW